MTDLHLFRVPKGTANYNAFRTLIAGTIATAALLLLGPSVMGFWDTYLRERPWITAVSIVKPALPPYGAVVEDTIRARWHVSGERRVWVETAGLRICDAERHDTWSAETTGRTWTFEAFTEGCPLPAAPFRVCTAFSVETLRGVRGAFGQFCSPIYDPRQ